MEKILSFLKKNMVSVILVVIIVIILCKPKSKVKEGFTAEDQVLGVCSDGIGGKLYPGQTKEACLSWNSNKKQYKRMILNILMKYGEKKKEFVTQMENKLKDELIWKEISLQYLK